MQHLPLSPDADQSGTALPIALAVAHFSPQTRRLLSLAREIALWEGAPALRGVHLFLGAAQLRGGGLPQLTRRQLIASMPEATSAEPNASPRFLQVSAPVLAAVQQQAARSPPVTPGSLLQQIFQLDPLTREELQRRLGSREWEELEEKMLLAGFTPAQRRMLRRLRRRQSREGRDDTPGV